MNFIYYNKTDLSEFENKLKALALDKNYKFNIQTQVLKEEEILKSSSDNERELLKIFKDNALITTYIMSGRKNNYLIIIGETKNPNHIGLTVIFDNKPLKQVGKMLLTVPILPILPFVNVLGVVGLGITAVGTTLSFSAAKQFFTIKGPLSKSIKIIIEETFGEPVNENSSQ